MARTNWIRRQSAVGGRQSAVSGRETADC